MVWLIGRFVSSEWYMGCLTIKGHLELIKYRIITLILQMRKQRHNNVNYLAPNPTGSEVAEPGFYLELFA